MARGKIREEAFVRIAVSIRRYKNDKYTVVVTCIILHFDDLGNRSALVVKRNETEQEGPGLWTVPGGKVQENDWGDVHQCQSHAVYKSVLERAIRREVYEEVGFQIGFVYPLKNKDIVFMRTDGTPTLVVTYYALCYANPRVTLSSELSDYRWLNLGDIASPMYSFIGNVREDVEDALKISLP